MMVVLGLTCPGQRMIAAVRIEPSVTSPNSPRNGTGIAHVRRSLVAEFACGLTLWSVVGGKDDDGVVVDAKFFQRVEDAADVVVALHQLIAVVADPRLTLELFRRKVRKVPHRERQIQEERLPGCFLTPHKINRLIH